MEHGDEEGDGLQDAEGAVDEDEVAVGALGGRFVGAVRGRGETIILVLDAYFPNKGKAHTDQFCCF